MRSSPFLLLVLLAWAPPALHASPLLAGPWVAADGEALLELSVGEDTVQVRLLALAESLSAADPAPRTVDARNPDPALRDRPLAGLVLGRLRRHGDAFEGRLYDPESGRTFSVATTGRTPSVLQLRAWVGLRVLGRTLLWVRPARWRARTDALLAAAEETNR